MVYLNATSSRNKFYLYPNTKNGYNLNLIDDLKFNILLSVFLTVLLVISVVGNISTCVVIVRNPSMRTPTNYYLFNLAIVDLVTALCIPFDVYVLWWNDYIPIGEIGCRIHFVIWDALTNCSVLTILAFSIERYIVITKPFLRQSTVLRSRVIKIITFNWLVSCLFCLLQVFNVFLHERDKGLNCYVDLNDKLLIIMGFDLFLFFALPMTVIFMIYILIAFKIKRTNKKLINGPANGKRNRDKAVTMLDKIYKKAADGLKVPKFLYQNVNKLSAVAASFFFCWSPYSVLQLSMIIPRLRLHDIYKVWEVSIYVALVNGYLSTVINPILYSLMSRKFQQAFRKLLVERKSLTLESINRVPILRTNTVTSNTLKINV